MARGSWCVAVSVGTETETPWHIQRKVAARTEDVHIARHGNGKCWFEQEADLSSMYAQFEHSTGITLFCAGRPESPNTQSTGRKWKSSYDDHKDNVNKLSTELAEKHEGKYNERQLRLWARMIVNHQHDDMGTRIAGTWEAWEPGQLGATVEVHCHLGNFPKCGGA